LILLMFARYSRKELDSMVVLTRGLSQDHIHSISEKNILKRIIDIVLSLLAIVFILSWLTPAIALIIRLSSKGPIFFKQRRVGLNGKEFVCYKFRTMRINDMADTLQATRTDPRITRVGHILRELNLDELPQFFNVLAGDMSIVGPRPHMLVHSVQFGKMIPDYRLRYLVKPGITGFAQIKGYRGTTPTYRSVYKRVQWDIYYARHQNLMLDLHIMLLTALHIVKRIFTWDGR
jgi:putative colanic acid biosysnthesis UDP-glucose lipid carrier transferase